MGDKAAKLGEQIAATRAAKTAAAVPVSPTQRVKRGFGISLAMFDRSRRPDYSEAGFEAACDEAINFVGERDWIDINAMLMRTAITVSDHLRVPAAQIHVSWVSTHKKTKAQGIEIKSNWGLMITYEIDVIFPNAPTGPRKL